MFGFNIEMYSVILEVYIGNQLVKRQQMQAPKEMLMATYMSYVQQIADDSRPMKVKMSRQEYIWDRFENKEKALTCEIEFRNNAWENS